MPRGKLPYPPPPPEPKEESLKLYTDGSCLTNPKDSGGFGGYAAFIIQSDEVVNSIKGGEKHTTNNAMELTAVEQGLNLVNRMFEFPAVHVYTDSAYVYQGATNWVWRWHHQSWKTARGNPVKNRGIWMHLLPHLKNLPIAFHHVRGHSGDKWNEFADDAAREQSESQKTLSKWHKKCKHCKEYIPCNLKVQHCSQRVVLNPRFLPCKTYNPKKES